MISWLLTSWPGQALAFVAALWFLNGLRKAILKPRLLYLSHSRVAGKGYFLTVRRQELLPPWRTLEERWFVPNGNGIPSRECDGMIAGNPSYTTVACSHNSIGKQLRALVEVAAAREKETEQQVELLERQLAAESRLSAAIAAAERKRVN